MSLLRTSSDSTPCLPLLVYCGLLLTLHNVTFAQGNIVRGVITDSVSGETIPFATVRVPGTPWATATNEAGFYLLPGIPPGSYQLVASCIGFKESSKAVSLGLSDNVRVDFRLEEELVKGPEVLVTERRDRALREIQTSVQVMDHKDLQSVPVTVQADVLRSVQFLPGIVSTSDVSSQFYVRGGAGDQNLILLDGIRIYSPYHALGILSIFDPDVIQAAEVYTGAFPAGYGGRLSSVVNLICRDGNRSTYSGKAGANFVSSTLALEGPVSQDITTLLSVRRSFDTGALAPFLGDRTAPLSFYDVFAKATLERDGGVTRLSLVSFLSGDDMIYGNANDADQTWRNGSIGITASGLIDERLFVSAIAYTSSFSAERRPNQSGERATKSLVSDFTIHTNATYYAEGQQTYLTGFDFNFPTLSYDLTNTMGSRVNLHDILVDGSAWVRYRRVGLLWSFDAGIHADLTSLFRQSSPYVLQPRISAGYSFADDWKLKASFARVTQHVITVNNEDDLVSVFDAWIPIPQGVNAEQSDHLVLGIIGSLGGRAGIDIQTYYKDYGVLVTYNRDKAAPEDPDYLGGNGSAYGVETMVRLDLDRIELLTSCSLSWVTVNNGGLTYPPRYDRRLSIKSLAVYRPSRAIDISVRWDFGSGLPASPSVASYLRPTFSDLVRDPDGFEPGSEYTALGSKNSIRLPSFHRLDVGATYRMDWGPLHLAASLYIVNLYDRKNIFYVDRETGRTVYSLPFLPSASLTLEYR